MSRCSWARPFCMFCGRVCNLGMSVQLLIRTSVYFVVYRVYPARCAWLMAACCHGDCGLAKRLDGSWHTM